MDLSEEAESERYQVRVARSESAVAGLRPFWSRMNPHPNADLDFFLRVISSRAEVERPHVVVLERDGTPQALLVGRLERISLPLKVGYITLFRAQATSLTIVYGGVLGALTGDVPERLVAEVRRTLSRGEADVAIFHQLDVESPLRPLIPRSAGFLFRQRFPAKSLHWRTPLSGSFDEFYESRSSKTRRNMRYYSKRLRNHFGDRIELHVLASVDDLETILADCETVASKTYHRGLGVGFVASEETRRLIRLSLERGWYRAYILRVEGKPRAYWTGHLYGGVFYTGPTGYDPAFRQHRLGFVLLADLIKHLCENEDVSAIDFGFGDAQYKQSFCEESCWESTVCTYAPSLRGLRLSALASLAAIVDTTARKLIGTTGTLRRVKRGWRERKASRKRDPSGSGSSSASRDP